MKNLIFGILFFIGPLSPQSAAAINVQSSSKTATTGNVPHDTVPRPNLPKDPYLAAIENIKSPYPALQLQAVEYLQRLRNPASIPMLIAALSNSKANVRAAIVHALGIMRAPQASSAISRLLVKDKSAQVRQSAAVALAYFADPASVPDLISALSDPSGSVRYAAMRTLGALRAPAAVPALIAILKSKNPQIQEAAVSSLGQIASSDAAPALISLDQDPNVSIRKAVATALGSIGGNSVQPALTQMLKDSDFSVRLQAASSLARLGNNAGIKTAFDGLKSKDQTERQRSIQILGLIGDKKALAALIKIQKTEKNPMSQGILQFAEAQIKARIGENPKSQKSTAAPARSK